MPLLQGLVGLAFILALYLAPFFNSILHYPTLSSEKIGVSRKH